MLLILITVFVLIIVNFGSGIIFRKILKIEIQTFVFISLLGMIGITLSENIIAFFLPLNFLIEIIFVIFGVIGFGLFLMKEISIKFQIKTDYWFYLLLFIIVFASSFSPYLFDYYSYYVPTISYLKEVGFVKGISNFDLLLGQTSFWHIYQAGFSHFTDLFLKINTYLSVLFLVYIYERKELYLLIFIPLCLLFVQQPSPDLPVFILTLIVINELINKKENQFILYLSLFAFCIKPIVFWLPLFVILNSFYHKNFKIKMIVPILIFGMLFTIKNIYLFGFPVFPLSIIDFHLPWKPRQEILNYSSQIGLMKSYDMKYSYQQILQFDMLEKIYHWFTLGYKSVFNTGIIICILIIIFFAIKEKSKFYYILLICLLLKSLLIISFSAQYRFLIDVCLVAFLLLFKKISESKAVFAGVFLSIFVSVMFTFPGFLYQFRGKWMSGFHWSQLYEPVTDNSVKILPEYKIGNFSFNASKNLVDKIYFPTLSLYSLKLYDYYGIFPQYFGKKLQNGIFQRKLSDEEKIELKKIISNIEKCKP